MRQVLKSFVMMAVVLVALLGARSALATSAYGVVFIHGTGDYPGTMTCSGQNCTVPAAYGGSNYWEAGEVASIANGLPYAVVGFDGGSCAPWPQSGDSTYGHTSTGSSCPLATTTGNADVIVNQIVQFLNTGVSNIVIVTHSGGSNQARYILNNYTRNSNYTAVKNATRRVITVAGTTLGTYLANEVFGGVVTSLIGGLIGFGGEGVNLLRTNYISTYNSSTSYLGAIQNPLSGVNFYSTGGVSVNISCVGVKVFGVCIGISNVQSLDGQATPLSACDSILDDTGLLALHDLYLNASDSSTARNKCSDGFISCMGSQRLGNTFSYSAGQDHNQSRRQCNNLDVSIRNMVARTGSGFDDYGVSSVDVSPVQLDACGFRNWSSIGSGSNMTYTEGCYPNQLGNGNCDWDCVALYGNDAVVTQWDSTGTKPLAWGASDCATSTETYNGTTYATISTIPFAENYTYTNANGTYWTQFNGATCTGTSAQCGGNSTSTTWFYDPNYGSSSKSAGVCPTSWIGDGVCDECAMFLYGGDGNDCAPGHINACAGMMTQKAPYWQAGTPMVPINAQGAPCTSSSQCPGMLGCSNGYCTKCTNNVNNASGSCNASNYGWSDGSCNTTTGICYIAASEYFNTNNAVYNELNPSGSYVTWQSDPASTNDGTCQETECGVSSLHLGTAAQVTPTSCTSSSQCPGMTACSNGYCTACSNSTNNASGSCNSTTYGWAGLLCNTSNGLCYTGTAQCNTSSDCVVGSCVNGGCTTLPSGSTSDCSYSYTAAGGSRACATNADCTGNACQNPTGNPNAGTCLIDGTTCTTDANCDVPSGATSTCNGSGYCSCTTSADCENGAACTNGTCTTTVTSSLCR